MNGRMMRRSRAPRGEMNGEAGCEEGDVIEGDQSVVGTEWGMSEEGDTESMWEHFDLSV